MKILVVLHTMKKKGGAVIQILKVSKELEKLGSEVSIFSIDEHITSINPFKIIRKASQILKEKITNLKPDIIFTSDPFFTTLSALKASKKQIPIVLRIGAVYDEFYASRLIEKLKLLNKGLVYQLTKWFLKFRSKLIFKRVDKVIFNSEYLKKKYAKVAPESVVIYNGVETSPLELKTSDAKLKLVYCGRIEPRKSIEIILETVKQLSEKGIENSLTLVGDTDFNSNYWKRLESIIERNDLHKYIDIKGEIPNENLPDILRQHDVLLFSTDDRNFPITEGLPNVILEGMAVGLVVIATGVAGVPEIIIEECGFIVKPNPDEFVRIIETLSNNPTRMQHIKSKATERIKDRFTISDTTKNYSDIFLEVLK